MQRHGAAVARADALSDLKAALPRLGGKQTVAATFEVSRSRHAKGRFLTQDFDGSATFDAEMNPAGVRITLSRGLIDRANDEEWLSDVNSDRTAPTAQVLQEVTPQTVERLLDDSKPLQRLIARGTVVEQRTDTAQGRPLRAVVLSLPKKSASGHAAGSFSLSEDTLTLWIDANGTPVASRRVRKGTAGVLFLKIEMTRTETASYAVRADHLVAMRTEDSALIDGPGSQKGTAKSVWQLRDAAAAQPPLSAR